MGFTVTKLPPILVEPSEQTPSGNLALSSIDRTKAVRVMVDLIFVYKHGQSAAKVVKDALAKTLVPYFPVAGRLVFEDDNGELEVACTAEGVWFVEAFMDCRLEDVNHLQLPIVVSKNELLPCPPPEVSLEACIFMIQVTQFTCRGFAVGIRFNHSVFDALGAAQFLKAIGDIARGLKQPTVQPIWCREAIPLPAKTPHPQGPLPSSSTFEFVTLIHDIGVDTINLIKNQYANETGQIYSTFEIVTAIFWQCRTRAIGLDPEAVVRLGFVANVRHLLTQVLPQTGGYYGNCVYPMSVEVSAKILCDGSVADVINIIRQGKVVMSTKFLGWIMGDLKEDPYKVPLDYGTCIVSDWGRVGFNEVDYGWGEPVHVAPLNHNANFIASCIFLKTSAPKQGVRFLTRCVVKDDLQALDQEITKLLKLYPYAPVQNKSL